MDISTLYVRMCEQADDIQKLWDFDNIEPSDIYFHHGDLSIWLPRQDQLQKMLPKEYTTIDAMFEHFVTWIYENDDYLEDEFAGNETAEQLWLTFIMKEKYNKTWNAQKEEWI